MSITLFSYLVLTKGHTVEANVQAKENFFV